jgi:hypothetical protein
MAVLPSLISAEHVGIILNNNGKEIFVHHDEVKKINLVYLYQAQGILSDLTNTLDEFTTLQCDISKDGRYLVINFGDIIQLWEIENKTMKWSYKCKDKNIRDLVIDLQNTKIAFAYTPHNIRSYVVEILSVSTGAEIKSETIDVDSGYFEGISFLTNALQFSVDLRTNTRTRLIIIEF